MNRRTRRRRSSLVPASARRAKTAPIGSCSARSATTGARLGRTRNAAPAAMPAPAAESDRWSRDQQQCDRQCRSRRHVAHRQAGLKQERRARAQQQGRSPYKPGAGDLATEQKDRDDRERRHRRHDKVLRAVAEQEQRGSHQQRIPGRIRGHDRACIDQRPEESPSGANVCCASGQGKDCGSACSTRGTLRIHSSACVRYP